MHIEIVTFHLTDLSEAQFRALCDELAPRLAAVPGLVAVVWLADPATNTYGVVNTWASPEARTAFTTSELFHEVTTQPGVALVAAQHFAVLDGPTRVTRGLIGLPA